MPREDGLLWSRVPQDSNIETLADPDGVPTLPAWVGGARRPPKQIGRFTLIEKIGEGGMGEVWSADDETLARKVAIKLVRRDRVDAEHEARLLREARTLAQLSHPNVVAVHDAGEQTDFVFIAMELIEGGTLRHVFRDPDVDWKTRLDYLLQAGRGLSAAHARGLVHRDFKPANALVGDDGRVRVADFGLARADGSVEQAAPHAPITLDGEDLTKTGAIVGTPAYMSPEQRLGDVVTSASDQFSFCLTAWEALYGVHPLKNVELASWVLGTIEVEPPPKELEVDPRIEHVLRRGLAVDPDARYASMSELLTALDRTQASRTPRARIALASVGAVALVATGVFATVAAEDGPDPCTASPSALSWGSEQRASLEDVLAAETATPASTRVSLDTLDAFASRWSALALEQCRAARTSPAPPWVNASRQCLDEGAAVFDAVRETLAIEETSVRLHAPDIAARLPDLAKCMDTDALQKRAAAAPRPGDAAKIREIEAALARVEPLRAAGLYDRAAEQLLAVERRTELLEHAPLLARLHILQAKVSEDRNQFSAAAEAFRVAYNDAERTDDDATAVFIAARLAAVVSLHLGEPERGAVWAELARSRLERLPKRVDLAAEVELAAGMVSESNNAFDDALTHFGRAVELRKSDGGGEASEVATALLQRAAVEDTLARYDTSIATLDEALDLRRNVHGDQHPRVATVFHQRAGTLGRAGHRERALADASTAVAMLARTVGREHSTYARALDTLAGVERTVGKDESALAHYDEAIAVLEQASDTQQGPLVLALKNKASMLNQLGRYAEAERMVRQVLEIDLERLGPDDVQLGYDWLSLGIAQQNLGREDEAQTNYERALEIRKKKLGPGHGDVAVVLSNLGFLALQRERWEQARGYFQEAMSIDQEVLGPAHPDLAYSLIPLAQIHLAEDEPSKALILLEQALAVQQPPAGRPSMRAEAHTFRAEAFVAQRKRSNASAELELAASAYRESGDTAALEKLRTWALDHALPFSAKP